LARNEIKFLDNGDMLITDYIKDRQFEILASYNSVIWVQWIETST
jgi:hypothetical protein